MRSIGIGILATVSLVGATGLFLFGMGARNIYRALASRGWPTVNGVVAESATTTSVTRDAQRSSTMYGARTVVQYQVAGHDFTTSTRHFGQFEGSGDATEAALEHYRFPVGKSVRVSYDPSNPAVATVHTGVALSALMLPFAGAGFLGATLLVLAMARGDGATGAVMIIFSLIFCAIGIALLVPGGVNLWHARASVAWPTTSARIVYGTPADATPSDSTTAVKAESDTGTVAPPSDSLQESTARHRLIFRFDVAGEPHFSNVRRFGQLAGSSDGNWSDSIAARYPLGARATIAYAPDNPDLAVLEPGVTKEALFLPGAGLAFLLFGLAVLLFAVPALTR